MSGTAPRRGSDIHDLAARIYVELIGASTRANRDPASVTAGAEAAATLSVELAEIFLRIEEKAAGARMPNSPSELDASNLAQWSAAAATPKK